MIAAGIIGAVVGTTLGLAIGAALALLVGARPLIDDPDW